MDKKAGKQAGQRHMSGAGKVKHSGTMGHGGRGGRARGTMGTGGGKPGVKGAMGKHNSSGKGY